ncbi:MAG: hypothetical protein AB7O59_05440 [Pirellulales bacterium]
MLRFALAVSLGYLLLAGQPLLAWQPAAQSAHAPGRGYTPIGERQWEIVFADDITVEEYARQIDYFAIEIAVVSKDGKIESISQVSKNKPAKRQTRKEREYRPAISWKDGTLYAADRRLLRKVGISSQGKELVHYLPLDLVERMEHLETEYGGKKIAEIRRTRFRVQAQDKGRGYEIVVIEQDPPKAGETASTVTKTINEASEK